MNPWHADSGNTLANRIREYVKAHPACDSTACDQALGVSRSVINTRMLCMSYDLVLVANGTGPKRTYTIGREVRLLKGLSPEDAKLRRKALKAERESAERAAARALREAAAQPSAQPSASGKAQPAPGPRFATYEEWLAAGAQPEVLPPARYVAPRVLPRFPAYSGENVHG